MSLRGLRFVASHFEGYRRLGKWPFLWRITLEGLLVPLGLGGLVQAIFSLPGRTDVDLSKPWRLALDAVIVAPFIETLLFQALPVMLVRRVRGGFWTQVAVSVALFATAHFYSGLATGIVAGLMTGFYIAFTYVHWRQTSWRSAVWMTTGSHALHNLALLVVGYATG